MATSFLITHRSSLPLHAYVSLAGRLRESPASHTSPRAACATRDGIAGHIAGVSGAPHPVLSDFGTRGGDWNVIRTYIIYIKV